MSHERTNETRTLTKSTRDDDRDALFRVLSAARGMGLDLCPSLTRAPGVVDGVLYYRPTTIEETRSQVAGVVAAHLAWIAESAPEAFRLAPHSVRSPS